jgi:putative effector of murein hydrolase LrgA (UPF0299 family)
MKSDEILLVALMAFFFLPPFVYAMKLALSGQDPE